MNVMGNIPTGNDVVGKAGGHKNRFHHSSFALRLSYACIISSFPMSSIHLKGKEKRFSEK